MQSLQIGFSSRYHLSSTWIEFIQYVLKQLKRFLLESYYYQKEIEIRHEKNNNLIEQTDNRYANKIVLITKVL